jgi:SAM-dependent methyltransferase
VARAADERRAVPDLSRRVAVPGAALPATLRAFIAESPVHRGAIVREVAATAERTPAGARVLDAGAGDAPYRPLFAHCSYITQDWPGSPHAGARKVDVVADLHDLPEELGGLDLVVCTEVLEHVADPGQVLAELHRVLRPGGELLITVPFVAGLHEEPHDFYRYTSHALRMLLGRAGFSAIDVEPLTGWWSTLASVLRYTGAIMTPLGERPGLAARAVSGVAFVAAELLRRVAPLLDRLDRRRALPLGWVVRARA